MPRLRKADITAVDRGSTLQTTSASPRTRSVDLPSQERRDVDDFFLDETAGSGGAAVAIEASGRRSTCMVRSWPCGAQVRGAGRRAEQRSGWWRRRYRLDPIGHATVVVAQPDQEFRQRVHR